MVWPTVSTYPVKTVTENARFQTLSSVEIFENPCLLFSCGRTKTEVFEYDDQCHTLNNACPVRHAVVFPSF